tara:strand:- start:857 stop:1078 length:222 start_codon:yes stop_codon:yes gene_type:complete
MILYPFPEHGCVYRMDIDHTLMYTPLNQDDTISLKEDDWIEVDFMSLLGEEEEVFRSVQSVEKFLLDAVNSRY